MIGAGVSLALALSSGKLACESYERMSHYQTLKKDILERNPESRKMLWDREILFYQFKNKIDNNFGHKAYPKSDSPAEIYLCEEFSELDKNNKKDFEDYLKFSNKKSAYELVSFFSALLCGGAIILPLTYSLKRKKSMKILENQVGENER